MSNINDDESIQAGGGKALSDATRNYVWQSQLDVVRWARYYGELEKRYNRRRLAFRFLLGLAGICTALPLVPSIPSILSSYASIAVIGIIVWDLVFDYGRVAAAIRVASEGMSSLKVRARSLWDETNNDSLKDKEARKRTDEIKEAALQLVSGIDIQEDASLISQCQRDSFQSEEYRYSAG